METRRRKFKPKLETFARDNPLTQASSETITIKSRSIVGEIPIGSPMCGYYKSLGFLYVEDPNAMQIKLTLALGEADNFAALVAQVSGDSMVVKLFGISPAVYIDFGNIVDSTTIGLTKDESKAAVKVDQITSQYNLPKGKIYMGVEYSFPGGVVLEFAALDQTTYFLQIGGELVTIEPVQNSTLNRSQPDIVGFLSDKSLYGEGGTGGDVAVALRNPTGNCITGGWLGGGDSGCGFTGVKQDDAVFLYTYASAASDENCGTTKTSFGTCSDVHDASKTCQFDSLSTLKTDQKNPYTCSPTDPEGITSWIRDNMSIVIGGIIGLVILVLCIGVGIWIISKRKSSIAGTRRSPKF